MSIKISKYLKFVYEILESRISVGYIIILSFIITSYVFSKNIEFGFNYENWPNFIIWHFAHRSYAHWIGNALILFLLISSGLGITLLELFILSLYVYIISHFNPIYFYGSSAIIYFLLGYILSNGLALKKFNLFGFNIKVPYFLFITVVLYSLKTTNLNISIWYLHLFSFLLGLIKGYFEKE